MDVSENNIDAQTTTSQFITYLIDALNEQDNMRTTILDPLPTLNPTPRFSRNSRPLFNRAYSGYSQSRTIQPRTSLPLFSRRNQLEELMQRTLYEENNNKKVLSVKGLDQLKVLKFNTNNFEMKECVITQEKFKENEEIVQLPCNHIFNKDAIETWLKEESSKCPICRFELDFIEKKKDIPENTRLTSTNVRLPNRLIQDSDISYNRLLNNLRFLYSPSTLIDRRIGTPRRSIINNMIDMESQYVHDRDLQNAILNSVMQTSNIPDNMSNDSIDDITDDITDDVTDDIIENDMSDPDVYLAMIENDLILEDIDNDENFFNN
jgi:hypothetical protein